MIKLSSKKYWIILISFCCISAGVAVACAWDEEPEYGSSEFTPEIMVDNTYSPFFFSNLFYYGINYDNQHDSRFNDINVGEWSTYLGKAIPSETIAYLLQSAAPGSIDSALTATQKRKDAKLSAFLHYLQIAKQAEAYSLNNYKDNWDYDRQKKTNTGYDVNEIDALCKKQLANADNFVKQRYWFQMERNYFFNGTPQQAIDFFDKHEASFSPGSIYYRSMAYAAGAWHQLKNYSKANYLYSKVYDHCPEMRTVAHYSFHPQEEADWNATLALCVNNKEKATLWQMLGVFYADGPRSIREIYQLDPHSDKMDLLMVREINSLEQNPSDLRNLIKDQDQKAAQLHLDSFYVLTKQIATEGKITKLWIWDLAAGYLSYLKKNYAEAQSWYAKAAKVVPNQQLPQKQLRLLEVVNKVDAIKKMDSRAENQILPDLEWLESPVDPKGPEGVLRISTAITEIKSEIALLYTQQHDPIKSECFVHTAAFYADDQQVAALKAFMTKPQKTPYEKYCAGMSTIRLSDICEYQAIQSAYRGQLQNAITLMVQSDTAGRVVLPGNPFNARIQDCHDCDFAAPQKIKYTKLYFLQKLKEMQDKLKAGTDVYTNAVLLGNAWYNMSQYGNARVFYECSIIGSEHSSVDAIDTSFQKMLTSMALSTQYYTQALNAATNDEQRAKCQYLLAKCERNEWYNQPTGQSNDPDAHQGPDFLAWKGFGALRQYSNTAYYKDVIRECGYFKTYVTQKNHQ